MSDNPHTTKPLDLDLVRTIADVTLGLQASALMRRMADEIERLRAALETIAQSVDAGRHDGLPEECPAHCADAMFAVAREALGL